MGMQPVTSTDWRPDLEGGYVRMDDTDGGGRRTASRVSTCVFCSLAFLGVFLFEIAASARLPATMISARPAALGPGTGSGSDSDSCGSFTLNVELNNIQGRGVPKDCEDFVTRYTKDRYLVDIAGAYSAATSYMETVSLKGDGSEAVVMDIDETLLSNLPYYAKHGYGSETFDEPSFNEWVREASAQPFEAALAFYNYVKKLNVKLVLLTGRDESYRNATTENLLGAGYEGWMKLILRSSNESTLLAVEYKSDRRSQVEKEGYEILTSVGDQWSDITGPAIGYRSFKIPNPMYYIY